MQHWLQKLRSLDPRVYQVACLATLLAYGLTRLDFDVRPAQIAMTLGAALVTQALFARLAHLPPPAAGLSRRLGFDPWSALISALSLCLLLRAGAPGWGAVAAVIAVGSKFVLRVGPKHLLNPTNGAIMLLLALGAPVWVSPAQWGQAAWFGFLMACAGSVVVTRAARADVTFAFLAAWFALVLGRAHWLGQPWATPLHALSNGGLLLFAFFMISDPKTTPDSRAGRIVFATLVALGAGVVQFVLWRTNGLLWSLVACSLLVPLIDRWLPGSRYHWSAPTTGSTGRHPRVALGKGVPDETAGPVVPAIAVLRAS